MPKDYTLRTTGCTHGDDRKCAAVAVTIVVARPCYGRVAPPAVERHDRIPYSMYTV